MQLPAELREAVYTQALKHYDFIIVFEHCRHLPKLLRTCKQIMAEGSPIFYRHNEFAIPGLRDPIPELRAWLSLLGPSAQSIRRVRLLTNVSSGQWYSGMPSNWHVASERPIIKDGYTLDAATDGTLRQAYNLFSRGPINITVTFQPVGIGSRSEEVARLYTQRINGTNGISAEDSMQHLQEGYEIVQEWEVVPPIDESHVTRARALESALIPLVARGISRSGYALWPTASMISYGNEDKRTSTRTPKTLMKLTRTRYSQEGHLTARVNGNGGEETQARMIYSTAPAPKYETPTAKKKRKQERLSQLLAWCVDW